MYIVMALMYIRAFESDLRDPLFAVKKFIPSMSL